MVSRVLQFSRTHPTAIEGHTEAVAGLEAKAAEATAFATQQQAGYLEVRAARKEKERLRERIHAGYLKPMAAIARAVAGTELDLSPRFELPPLNLDQQAYLAMARAMLAQATPHRAVFVRQGMPEQFLEDLDRLLVQYEEARGGTHAGTSLHVGARAELKEISRELLGIVRRLDVINRLRFQDEPEQFAAWRSARDVAYPLRSQAVRPRPRGRRRCRSRGRSTRRRENHCGGRTDGPAAAGFAGPFVFSGQWGHRQAGAGVPPNSRLPPSLHTNLLWRRCRVGRWWRRGLAECGGPGGECRGCRVGWAGGTGGGAGGWRRGPGGRRGGCQRTVRALRCNGVAYR